MPASEVEEVNHRSAEDSDFAAWLEEVFVDDDDNLPFYEDREIEGRTVPGVNA